MYALNDSQLLHQDNTLIQHIQDSNKLVELLHSCHYLISTIQKKIDNQETEHDRSKIDKHLDKLIRYDKDNKLSLLQRIVYEAAQGPLSKPKIGANFISALTLLKAHLDAEQENIYLQVETSLKKQNSELNKLIKQHTGEGCTLELYPLNLALDDKIVQLLLESGADATLLASELELLKRESQVRFTALELACSKGHYEKAHLVLTFAQQEIDIDSIEKAYYYLFNSEHLSVNSASDIQNPNFKKLVHKLSEKVSLKLAYDKLNTLHLREQKIKELLLCIPDFDRQRIATTQKEYKLIKSNLDFYKFCANRSAVFPIWAILLSGIREKDSHFGAVPLDVIQLIIASLCDSDYVECTISQINTKRLREFKNLCLSLKEHGFESNNFFAQLFNIKSNESLGSTIEFIRNISSDSILPLRSRLLVKRAWDLACDSYETNTMIEVEFDNLMQGAQCHSMIKAHIKILTIMAKYNKDLQFYKCFDRFEHTISADDFELLEQGAKQSPGVYVGNRFFDIGSTYEELLSEIKNQSTEPSIATAIQLAEQHHLKFNSQNKALIEALALWVLKTNPQSNGQGFFSSPNEAKKDIALCINKLNDNQKIIVEVYSSEELGHAVCTMGRI